MIKTIKDFTKVTLNSQDVMINVKVKINSKTTLDLSAMDKKSREDLEANTVEIEEIEVLAAGPEAVFQTGQLVALKSNNTLKTGYEAFNEEDTQRVYVIHMNNIAYAITK